MLPMLRHSIHWPSLLTDFLGKELAATESFGKGFSIPAVNVAELGDRFQIEVAAPGLTRKDFNIEVNNNVLSISSEKEEKSDENKSTYHRREFSYFSFQRSFALPEMVDIDKISATHSDGILKIEIPKKEEAKQKPSRVIEIQ